MTGVQPILMLKRLLVKKRLALPLALAVLLAASGAQAIGFTDLLVVPKALVDYALEARTATDIGKDNDIVLRVNAIMADMGTLNASTEIYEQRLLITGLFEDKAQYDRFHWKVKSIPGLRALYWHAVYLAPDDSRRKQMLSWTEALLINGKAGARLLGDMDVADLNYRLATDAGGVVYVLGRARSADEKSKALQLLRDGDGVTKVVDYIEVKP